MMHYVFTNLHCLQICSQDYYEIKTEITQPFAYYSKPNLGWTCLEKEKKEEEETEEAKEIFFFSHIYSHIYPWPHIPRESRKPIRIPLSSSSPFYSPLHLDHHVLSPLSIFRQLLNWPLKFPRRHLDTQVSQKPLTHSLWKLTPFAILSLCQQLPSVYFLFHAMFQPHWTMKTRHLGIWYLKIDNSET